MAPLQSPPRRCCQTTISGYLNPCGRAGAARGRRCSSDLKPWTPRPSGREPERARPAHMPGQYVASRRRRRRCPALAHRISDLVPNRWDWRDCHHRQGDRNGVVSSSSYDAPARETCPSRGRRRASSRCQRRSATDPVRDGRSGITPVAGMPTPPGRAPWRCGTSCTSTPQSGRRDLWARSCGGRASPGVAARPPSRALRRHARYVHVRRPARLSCDLPSAIRGGRPCWSPTPSRALDLALNRPYLPTSSAPPVSPLPSAKGYARFTVSGSRGRRRLATPTRSPGRGGRLRSGRRMDLHDRADRAAQGGLNYARVTSSMRRVSWSGPCQRRRRCRSRTLNRRPQITGSRSAEKHLTRDDLKAIGAELYHPRRGDG